jgi:hypothetical protein
MTVHDCFVTMAPLFAFLAVMGALMVFVEIYRGR